MTERRKQIIHDVIIDEQPDIVLFQEFKWESFRHPCWKNFQIPQHYGMIQDATDFSPSILYNINKFECREFQLDELRQSIDETKRQTNNSELPSEYFNKYFRMTIGRMFSEEKEFISISWHGFNNDTKENKINNFRCLMTFIRLLFEEKNVPMIIGGDFNIKICDVKNLVHAPFRIIEYNASERRKLRTTDFFIVTDTIREENIRCIDLEKVSDADNPNSVMDHDPIVADFELAHHDERRIELNVFSSTDGVQKSRTINVSEDGE